MRIIEGTINKADSTPIENAKLQFRLEKTISDASTSSIILAEPSVYVSTDSLGAFSINLVEGIYLVTLPDNTKFRIVLEAGLTSINLQELIDAAIVLEETQCL